MSHPAMWTLFGYLLAFTEGSVLAAFVYAAHKWLHRNDKKGPRGGGTPGAR